MTDVTESQGGDKEDLPPTAAAKLVYAPQADIQAIVIVLGRRNRSHDAEGSYLDLISVDLRQMNLKGVHLEEARLTDALNRPEFPGDSAAWISTVGLGGGG